MAEQPSLRGGEPEGFDRRGNRVQVRDAVQKTPQSCDSDFDPIAASVLRTSSQ